MPLLAPILIALVAPQDPVAEPVDDPRTRPTRIAHALYTIDCAIDFTRPLGAVGDLDGDGLDEVLAPNSNGMSLLKGGTGAELKRAGGPTVRGDAFGAIGPDLDGDGIRDLAWSTGITGLVDLWSIGKWEKLRSFEYEHWPFAQIAWLDDINGDDVPDLALAWDAKDLSHPVSAVSSADGAEHWRVNAPGTSDWGEIRSRNDPWATELRLIPDVNGDGVGDLCARRTDLVEAPQNWFLSGANGQTFEPPESFNLATFPLGDVDADGTPDIASILTKGSGYRIHASSGGGWEERLIDAFEGFTPVRSIGDVNGDGHADVAVGEPEWHMREREGGDLDRLSLERAVAHSSRGGLLAQDSGVCHVRSGRDGSLLMAVFGEADSNDGVGLDAYYVGDQSGDGIDDIAVRSIRGVHVFATRL